MNNFIEIVGEIAGSEHMLTQTLTINIFETTEKEHAQKGGVLLNGKKKTRQTEDIIKVLI